MRISLNHQKSCNFSYGAHDKPNSLTDSCLVTHSHLDAQSIRGQHDSQTDPLGPHRPPPSPHPHTRLSRPGEGQRWGWTEV